ncbi:hypothetical protein RB2150 [Rhodopirellula baltica SH 1]|uniref:Uncharacterized protein n=1 Tax=Rhodopirellula baltica (strain DSM 10527 / NCIMB 13988 / SH1) TaxID=243090 RepID=Q7UWB2_RHOBA|nr:hypothetical protein RB2150 [Rhodopirellula baltica SH 1]
MFEFAPVWNANEWRCQDAKPGHARKTRTFFQESDLGGYQEIWQGTTQGRPQETTDASQDSSPQEIIFDGWWSDRLFEPVAPPHAICSRHEECD